MNTAKNRERDARQQIDDQEICSQTLSRLKNTATNYMELSLESNSPEIRRLCTEHLYKSLAIHEEFKAYAVEKGWIEPDFLNTGDLIAQMAPGLP